MFLLNKEGLDWVYLVQDTDHYWARVNAAMYLGFP